LTKRDGDLPLVEQLAGLVFVELDSSFGSGNKAWLNGHFGHFVSQVGEH